MKKDDNDSRTSSLTASAPQRRFRPKSPVLDEKAILAQLAVTIDPAHTNQPTRSASVMAIVNAYDRGVPRGPFLQVVGRAVNLNERIRQVELLMSMRMEIVDDKCTREQIVEKIDKFAKASYEAAEEYRIGLHRDTSYIGEMAWDGDAIN